MTRVVTHRYEDPLDALWLQTAEAMGLRVLRGPESYASTDGHGALTLTDAQGMDPDDCLAQMLLHEICHSLVQGSQSFGWVDWGLDNEGTRDQELEHACLRLQAALLGPYGLRQALGPTTDFRAYYDALPPDPFFERYPSERESIVRARAAYARRDRPPWGKHLSHALRQTAVILQATRTALGNRAGSLWALIEPELPLHSVGIPLHPDQTRACKDCAWAYPSKKEPTKLRCRQADGKSLKPNSPACERHEPKFDCLSCGACCREAYDAVEVSPSDPASRLHLPLLIPREVGYDMQRVGPRCVCLRGGVELPPLVPAIHGGATSPEEGERVPPRILPGGEPFTCSIYETRPRTCRDFTIFSSNCLTARRTVGLSR